VSLKGGRGERERERERSWGCNILYRVEQLLCNDHEISEYTRPVSRQWLGKYVPRATNRRATIEVSSVRESVKSGLERVKLNKLHC
jgi:hypothetical protein